MADTTVREPEPADSRRGSPPAEQAGPAAVAAELLAAIRAGEDPNPFLDALATFDDADLHRVRNDRQTGLAFWLNCYNAGTQLLLARRPALYESPLRFLRFFSARALTVAGTDLSLNDIEDGILRASRSKYTMGYTPSLFQTSFEQRYAVQPIDSRIHFALNCGAASCPPIRVYDPETVDEQLELATERYLDQTVEYDPERNRVRLPRVFLWYRGDFGGARGTRQFLRGYEAIPVDITPKLQYRSWDWEIAAGNFSR